ncbi:MAG: hypothetical protein MRY83_03315, partial [Flavobacteriales bacterium]|nr:hypothetical protein [Flavobacteriales bacterium]
MYDNAPTLVHTNPDSLLAIVNQIEMESYQANDLKSYAYCKSLKAYIFRVSPLHNADSNMHYLRTLLEIAKQINSKPLICIGLNNLAKSFLDNNQFDSAYFYCYKAREMAAKNNAWLTFIESSKFLAWMFEKSGKSDIAIDLLYDVEIKYKQGYVEPHQANIVFIELVRILMENDSLDDVERLLNDISDYFKDSENKHWLNQVNQERARWLTKQARYEEALEIINHLISKSRNISDFTQFTGYSELRFPILEKLGRYNQMRTAAESGYRFLKQNNYEIGQNIMQYYLAKSFLLQKDTTTYLRLARGHLDLEFISVYKTAFLDTYYKVLIQSGLPYKEVGLLKKQNDEEIEAYQRSLRLSIEDVTSILEAKKSLLNQTIKEKETSKQHFWLSTLGLLIVLAILFVLYRRYNRSKTQNSKDRKILEKQLLQLKKVAVTHIKTIQKLERQSSSILEKEESTLSVAALEGNWVDLITQFKTTYVDFLNKLEFKAGRPLTKT